MKTPPQSTVSKKVVKTETTIWNGGRLFWGLFLVVIGGLFLVNNFGIASVRFDNLWRLWPLAIILAGLTTISIRHWLWKTIIIVFILLSMATLVWIGLGGVEPNSQTSTQSLSSQQITYDVKRAEVSIKAGASRLSINSNESDVIAQANLDSSRSKIEQTSRIENNVANISYSMQATENWWRGSSQNSLDISLTRKLPIDLLIDAGASDIRLNLEEVNLNSLNVSAGASSVIVRLGNKALQTKAMIDAGASSVIIRVPRSSGVEIKLDSGLVGASLDDFKEIDKTTYQTANFATAEKTISLQAKVGLASFRVERY